MTTFALNYKLHSTEDAATIRKVLEAWEGQQVAEAVWILRRNDGCTCQDVMEDLLDHISAENEISVKEIKQEKYLNINEQVC